MTKITTNEIEKSGSLSHIHRRNGYKLKHQCEPHNRIYGPQYLPSSPESIEINGPHRPPITSTIASVIHNINIGIFCTWIQNVALDKSKDCGIVLSATPYNDTWALSKCHGSPCKTFSLSYLLLN